MGELRLGREAGLAGGGMGLESGGSWGGGEIRIGSEGSNSEEEGEMLEVLIKDVEGAEESSCGIEEGS